MERRTERYVQAAAGAMALFQLPYGFYFDWSDRFIYLALGMVLAGIAWVAPRVSFALSLGLLLLVGAATVLRPADSLAAKVLPGQSWASVKAALGPAALEARNLSQATGELNGYAEPSPWRYPTDLPVAVFLQGERALWVFHDKQRVVERFEGGS